jgi:hypothetical protein
MQILANADMPGVDVLNGYITSFSTLAATAFGVGVTLAIGRIGWRMARRYFFGAQ